MYKYREHLILNLVTCLPWAAAALAFLERTALGPTGVGWRRVFLTLAAVEFKKEVRVGLVKGDWLKVGGRSNEVEIEQTSRMRLRAQIALLVRPDRFEGGRLTLGVLSPGDLQELLDVGDLLGLLFQIRP